MQTLEEVAKGAEVVPAEQPGPVLLDLSDQLASNGLRLGASYREADELGATVVGVRDSLDVAKPFEVVHQVDDAGLGDLRESREVGDARPLILDVLPDRAVSRTEVGEAALSQPFTHQLVDRERGVAQERPEVGSTGPLLARA